MSSRRRHTRYWRDWSSDVCSSDLDGVESVRAGKFLELTLRAADREEAERLVTEMCRRLLANPVIEDFRFTQIGRASCSERVEISVAPVSLTKTRRSALVSCECRFY